MRTEKRKIQVRLIEQEYINNSRLIEYFANKYKEKRGSENDRY